MIETLNTIRGDNKSLYWVLFRKHLPNINKRL